MNAQMVERNGIMVHPFEALSFFVTGFLILRIGLRPGTLPGNAGAFYGQWQRLPVLVVLGARLIAATLVSSLVR
jgi:hypothetical protein